MLQFINDESDAVVTKRGDVSTYLVGGREEIGPRSPSYGGVEQEFWHNETVFEQFASRPDGCRIGIASGDGFLVRWSIRPSASRGVSLAEGAVAGSRRLGR